MPQVVEDTFRIPVDDTMTIHNPNMLAMLIRWLPDLPESLCLWLSNLIYDLCSSAVHNKQVCCSADLIRVVNEVLSGSQMEQSYIGTAVEGVAKIYELIVFLCFFLSLFGLIFIAVLTLLTPLQIKWLASLRFWLHTALWPLS